MNTIIYDDLGLIMNLGPGVWTTIEKATTSDGVHLIVYTFSSGQTKPIGYTDQQERDRQFAQLSHTLSGRANDAKIIPVGLRPR